MNNTIFKRIRNRKGNPRGILIAKPIDSITVGIGWSLCSNKDTFDLAMGKQIAEGRTTAFNSNTVPHSIQNDFNIFAKRCNLYFKGQTVIGTNLFEKII